MDIMQNNIPPIYNQDEKVSVASISPSGYGIASVPDCRGCSIRLVKDDGS